MILVRKSLFRIPLISIPVKGEKNGICLAQNSGIWTSYLSLLVLGNLQSGAAEIYND